MELRAKSSEKAFVDLSLYIMSNNVSLLKRFGIQKKIFRILFIVSCVLFCASIFLRMWDCAVLSFIILLISLSYTKFVTWQLRNSMKKQYATSGLAGVDCTLTTNDGNLEWSNGKIEFNTKIEYIKRIVEVGGYFFLDLDMNQSLALDKTNIDEIDKVKQELKFYSETYSIPYLIKLDWDSNIFSKNNIIC